jgi:hypothetical protein
MELVNGVTVPSLVHGPEDVVGVVEVLLQQTPSAVMGEPPLDVTLPPPVAVVEVIFEMLVVVTVGKAANVVNVTSLP